MSFQRPPAGPAALPPEIAFLLAEGVDARLLVRAAAAAAEAGTDAATALMNAGLIAESAYYAALARALGAPTSTERSRSAWACASPTASWPASRRWRRARWRPGCWRPADGRSRTSSTPPATPFAAPPCRRSPAPPACARPCSRPCPGRWRITRRTTCGGARPSGRRPPSRPSAGCWSSPSPSPRRSACARRCPPAGARR
ncbi:hypothetical protein ACU4GA_26680 [Methylobacterium oryzae CBMB20]